jgi:hypothetical protein
MKLYKGIDNTFAMKLMNGDEKLLNVVGQTVWWQLLDRDTAELKLKTSVVVQGSDNAKVQFTITEGDLEPLKSGHYMYSTYLEDDTGKRTILYADSQFGASVPVEIVENAFPQVLASQEVLSSQFTSEGNGIFYTSALNGHPDLNSNTGLHSVAIYADNFNGNIEIQVTLENGHTDIMDWSVLKTMPIVPDSLITYGNFNGVFSWVRFRIVPADDNTGTIDKILYRS